MRSLHRDGECDLSRIQALAIEPFTAPTPCLAKNQPVCIRFGTI